MNAKEFLIVTRCFWPQCGHTELALADLARNLHSVGHHVTIATVHWSRQWSANIEFHGIPVMRVSKPVIGPWGTFRYARLLAKRLSDRTYDAVIVAGAGDEAASTLRCIDKMIPVIVRLDDRSFDPRQTHLSRKQIECCLNADALVATSQTIADRLGQFDQMPEMHVIPDGIRTENRRLSSETNKKLARQALSLAHPVLQIEPNQPLVISFSPFERRSGLDQLVKIWPEVLRRLPESKLWLVGDGPEASKVWQTIVSLDLAHSVVMPGYFDNMLDLFDAADLYIHPSAPEASIDGLLRAISGGLPFLTTAADEILQFSPLETHQELGTAGNWSRAILDQLIDLDLRLRNQNETLREIVQQHYCPRQQLEQYLSLVHSISSDQVSVAK